MLEKVEEKKLKNVEKKLKTLPEAQRTQGIEFITWIIFLTEINLKVFQMKKFIQVLNSIPWVRCASGNVFNFFSTFSQLFPNSCSTLFSTFFQLFLNFFQYFTNLFSTFSQSLFQLLFSINFQLFLNLFQILHRRTCISSYFGHQVALLELVAYVATRWHYLY